LLKVQDLEPQVVLVDLAMVGLPGLEVIPRLRTVMPDAGIIALTLLNTDHFRQAALEAGADEFVPKSSMRTNLIPIIRRLAQSEREAEPETAAAMATASDYRRVLVIEDDAHLSRLYAKALRSAGYEVYPAETIQEARNLLDDTRFDVLLCDIRVGQDNGTDLLREYSGTLATSGTQVIMVSGQAQYRAMCEEMGADFFLEKPVAIGTLVALVSRLAARS
jgi:DNA-binding response OmpR family regulator